MVGRNCFFQRDRVHKSDDSQDVRHAAKKEKLSQYPAAPGAVLGSTETARQYRSTAPVELVQCPRISLPLAQLRIRPPATLAAGQVHAGKLKCSLGRGTFHPRWLSGLILQRSQRRLSETSDPKERRLAPSDLNCGRLSGQPVTDHGAPQSFEQATLFSRKDRLQLATLLGICAIADVQTSGSLAAKEIAWPFRRESDLGSVEIYTVGIAALSD